MINVEKVTKYFDDFCALDEFSLKVESGSPTVCSARTVRENPHCFVSLPEYTGRTAEM